MFCSFPCFLFSSVPARHRKAVLELLRMLYPESVTILLCVSLIYSIFVFVFQLVILGAKHNVRRRRKTAQRKHAKRTKRLPLPQKWTHFFCKKIQHSFKVCSERKDWLDSRKGKTLRDHLASVREYHLFICLFNLHVYIGDIFYDILIYILIFILFI